MSELTLAGALVAKTEVSATLKMLRYYRAFLKQDKFTRCINPGQSWPVDSMTKEEVEHRLRFLINVAINRKAGIPDVSCRKQTSDYQAELYRDCRQVRDYINHRVRPYTNRFETREIHARYGWIIERCNDDRF